MKSTMNFITMDKNCWKLNKTSNPSLEAIIIFQLTHSAAFFRREREKKKTKPCSVHSTPRGLFEWVLISFFCFYHYISANFMAPFQCTTHIEGGEEINCLNNFWNNNETSQKTQKIVICIFYLYRKTKCYLHFEILVYYQIYNLYKNKLYFSKF